MDENCIKHIAAFALFHCIWIHVKLYHLFVSIMSSFNMVQDKEINVID